jgi:transcriptional regulator
VLIRAHDAGRSEEQWRTFVRKQGFGHFAVSTAHAPVVVPTQFLLGETEIRLHLAANNPVFAALEVNPTAVLSVAGDWAYIPGGWKMIGDEDPTLGVPTTYYAAVQIVGRVTIVDDAEGLADILRSQVGDLEEPGALADPTVHTRRFPAIRGLRLSIDDVRSKFKYGGNVDAEHRATVAAKLRRRGHPGDEAAAEHVDQI